MKLCYKLLLMVLYISCQSTPSKDTSPFSYPSFAWLEDSIIVWETQWKEEQTTKALNEAEGKLALFLGLLSPQAAILETGDTLLTLKHDYSFAGFIGAQYTQILKTNTSLQLTQAAYNNYEHKEEGHPLVNPLTGMDFGKVYQVQFQQKNLTNKEWEAFKTQLQASDFMKMGKEECDRIVMDGTYMTITFHSSSHTHKVSRHNCPAPKFHQLAQHIAHLSPAPVQF